MRPSLLLDLHPSSTWEIFVITLKWFLLCKVCTESTNIRCQMGYAIAHLLYSCNNLRVPEVVCFRKLQNIKLWVVHHCVLLWLVCWRKYKKTARQNLSTYFPVLTSTGQGLQRPQFVSSNSSEDRLLTLAGLGLWRPQKRWRDRRVQEKHRPPPAKELK